MVASATAPAATCLGETTGRDGLRKTLDCSKSCSPAVLLYPNKHDIDKYGPNEGWYCGKGAGGSGCVSNDRENMTMGRGEAEPSWMPLFDPSYKRPNQGTVVDKQLAKDLKKFGVKEGDPLPPLNPAALADLERSNPAAAKRYKDSLRPLTDVEKAFTAARAASAESNAQYVKDEGNKELPGLNRILDKVKKAGSTGTLTKDERNLWAKAQKRYPLYDVDRGIVNGLDQIQAQEVFIDAEARGLGEGDLAKFFTGESSKDVNAELQELLGVTAKGQQVTADGGVIVSSAEEAKDLPKGLTRSHSRLSRRRRPTLRRSPR